MENVMLKLIKKPTMENVLTPLALRLPNSSRMPLKLQLIQNRMDRRDEEIGRLLKEFRKPGKTNTDIQQIQQMIADLKAKNNQDNQLFLDLQKGADGKLHLPLWV